MRKLALLLPLIIAACGTSPTPVNPDAQAPTQKEGKTIHQLLQEPGWTEVSPNYWERPTEGGGTQSIYIGLEGAKGSLKARQAELAVMTAKLSGQSGAEEQLAHLQRGMDNLADYIESVPAGAVTEQASRYDCTSNASVDRMSASPGIKAHAWMQCPGEFGPKSSAFVRVGSMRGFGEEDWNLTSTSSFASLAREYTWQTCYGESEAYMTVVTTRYGARATGTWCGP